jgi:hypothetical protein
MDSRLKLSAVGNVILSMVLLIVIGYHFMTEKNRPVVIGKAERVGVEAIETSVKARIDTGAGVTSLNAQIIDVTKSPGPGGSEKVKFQIRDDAGNTRTLEKDVMDWQNIKNKGGDGYTKRPVVKMDLCLGGKEIYGRVNLVDRSNFRYQLLIGRNFLETGDFVVDAGQELTSHRSKCN